MQRDRTFFFAALEGTGNFTRPNLSLGATACPIANPTVPANEALINGNEDCQRTALLSFMNTRLGMNEAVPIEHPIETLAVLAKIDVAASTKTNVSGSWNFNHSRKGKRDVRRGDVRIVANGVEGDPRASTSRT